MNTFQIISLSLLMGLFSHSLSAQKKVESGTYNTMLKTFLSHNVTEVSVAELAAIESDAEPQYLDARESEEYAVSHIKGAIHVGYDVFDSTAVANLDRNTPIVVYCSIGYRSEKIAEKLEAMGFSDVKNLYGGIFEWVNQGQPVYHDDEPTDRVHAYSRTWGIWLNKGEKVYRSE
jgi:rhodanese-related sulfurtransferase